MHASRTFNELRELLEEKTVQYGSADFFVPTDPISIPARYQKKEDIEISGFLVATIAWGQRKSIISNGLKLCALMDDAPHDFVMHHQASDLKRLEGFVHRTFNDSDLLFFVSALQHLYQKGLGLEGAFQHEGDLGQKISSLRNHFMAVPHLSRSLKHIANPLKGSSAKRLCMYLRWMVRQPGIGCDFGIWSSMHPSELYLPLDVHSGRIARKLGLLHRTQDDWRAVEELTHQLRAFDPADPCKYDYALFGMGAFESMP
ncbi:MAG TPA: TIGR02757 family protein [Luteibaculaceae bacterium]|nr:TIGR02757 family protein [Luteibaculaceae bacterium]